MAPRMLGLDITEESLCAVVVRQQGRERRVLAVGRRDLEGYGQVAEVLPELLAEVDFTSGSCVVGLPLSLLSLRNLTLPFSDRRKMLQVLPLELEEQLLVPADDLVVDFQVTSRNRDGSRLLVAALDREFLRSLLAVLTGCGLTVTAVLPSAAALAGYLHSGKSREAVLLLQAQPHGMNTLLLQGSQVVFMRFVAYPELVLDEFFSPRHADAPLDRETVEEHLVRVCELTRASLYMVQQQTGMEITPERALLSGGMIEEDWWTEAISRSLGITVRRLSLPGVISGLRLESTVQNQWQQGVYDSALALALHGLAGKKAGSSLDFLKEEFAPGGGGFLSRQGMLGIAAVVCLAFVGSIGYLWNDYRKLDARATALHEEMKQIFTETFPDVTRIVDPLVQMQSRMREVQDSEVSLPLFFGEKRVLETLADISARIPQEVSLHVSRLVIDKEAVQIKGTTDAYNNVDVIKNKLAASPRYSEVKIVSATADKKTKKIRFEIRLQFAEAS